MVKSLIQSNALRGRNVANGGCKPTEQKGEKHMELMKGKVDLTMSVTEVVHINDLIERDTAMPIKKSVWEYDGKKYTDFKCSKCDNTVKATDGFCNVCGQRLDTETIAVEGGE